MTPVSVKEMGGGGVGELGQLEGLFCPTIQLLSTSCHLPLCYWGLISQCQPAASSTRLVKWTLSTW